MALFASPEQLVNAKPPKLWLLKLLSGPQSTRVQIGRFLLVGGTAAMIDFYCYWTALHHWGFTVYGAKAFGFLIGTIFAYFLNKLWTFSAAGGTKRQFLSFVGLYCTGICVNVAINSGCLHLLERIHFPRSTFAIVTAFVIATGCSATWNFVGLKFMVFRRDGSVPVE